MWPLNILYPLVFRTCRAMPRTGSDADSEAKFCKRNMQRSPAAAANLLTARRSQSAGPVRAYAVRKRVWTTAASRRPAPARARHGGPQRERRREPPGRPDGNLRRARRLRLAAAPAAALGGVLLRLRGRHRRGGRTVGVPLVSSWPAAGAR